MNFLKKKIIELISYVFASCVDLNIFYLKKIYKNKLVTLNNISFGDSWRFYIDKYNISSITLYDLTAITKKRWIIDFCNRLIKEKIHLSWSLPSGTRSEVLDEEVLGLLKRTGCDYLVYAPESGSVDTLVKIKKQISLHHPYGFTSFSKKTAKTEPSTSKAHKEIKESRWPQIRSSWRTA